METSLSFAIVIIAVALVFDLANGWHDSANSIATVVSTRVLSPVQAVVWAAFFNFVAFAVLGTGVAKTIASDMVDIKRINGIARNSVESSCSRVTHSTTPFSV